MYNNFVCSQAYKSWKSSAVWFSEDIVPKMKLKRKLSLFAQGNECSLGKEVLFILLVLLYMQNELVSEKHFS